MMLRYLNDLLTLVEINLKVRYRQTFVGFLWVILNPILLYSVQALLFKKILNQADENYYLYLLSGLLPWFYISQTTEMGSNYVKGNARIIKNFKIHPFKLITSLALENYINFLSASVLILLFISIDQPVNFSFLMRYVLASFWLVAIVTQISFISSLLNVLFKDTRYILHFVFTIFYFTTPTFFYVRKLPENFQFLVNLNPFYWMISLFREAPDAPPALLVVVVNVGFLILLSFLSYILWKKLRNKIYLNI